MVNKAEHIKIFQALYASRAAIVEHFCLEHVNIC